MVDWPSSLPDAPLTEGFAEKRLSAFVDDVPEIGAARRRARFTRTLRRFAVRYLLTSAQKDALVTFFESTLSGSVTPTGEPVPVGGVLSFNWTHPDTGEVIVVRFGADGFNITATAFELWEVSMMLEEV